MKKSVLFLTMLLTIVAWSQQDHKCMSPVVTDGDTIKYIDSDYQLQDLPTAEVTADAYFFDPVEWEIGDDPEKNRVQLQAAIDYAKSISKGRTVFKMGACDFFIQCSGDRLNIHDSAQNYGVHIPSDIHILMTDETKIRVSPNSHTSFAIFGIHKEKNITFSNGHLIGDIFEHDYSQDPDSHEYGALVLLSGAVNIKFFGVDFQNGTGDNLMIGDSSNIPEGHNSMYNSKINPNDYVRTRNILVDGCFFRRGGRNNISILSGSDMIFRNNDIGFASTVNPTPNSPACGIDAEAYRYSDPKDVTHETGVFHKAGTLHEFERIENVSIYNNHFHNNVGASVNMFTIFNSNFENNYCEEGVLAAYGSKIRISKNSFINRGTTRKEAQNGFANNSLGYNIQGDRVKSEDIKITNNRFDGFPAAALIRNNNVQFNGNTLVNNKTGVVIGNSKNNKIYDNHIVSNVPESNGITSQSSTIDNIIIRDNYIDVDKYAIHLFNTNSDSIANDLKVNVLGNIFKSKIHLQKVTGLNFKRNEVFKPMIIENQTNFIIKDNDFNVEGVALRGYFNQTNGMILKNDFLVNSGKSYGIILSHSNDQNIYNITILSNYFVGKKANRLIYLYGDGFFNDVKVSILPQDNNVKDFYRSLDFNESLIK